MNPPPEKLEDEKLATFGGGCFWCTEAIFQRLDGVSFVESGYSGGIDQHPDYHRVSSGESDHAEVVQVTYDPARISFKQLLLVHLGTHDPTTPNAQGEDYGPQYRSLIFFRTESERLVAEELLENLALSIPDEVVTEVLRFTTFHAAESDHQNFYNSNSGNEYCQRIIEPKLEWLQQTVDEILNQTGPS